MFLSLIGKSNIHFMAVNRYGIGCASSASPGVSRLQFITEGHSIDLDYVAALPIGALPAYSDLAKFQLRHASGEACFPS